MPRSRISQAPNSNSAAATFATAAALQDAWFQPQMLEGSELQQLRRAAQLPDMFKQRIYSSYFREKGLDPALAKKITTDGLARQVVAAYEQIEHRYRYPAVILGAPNGGIAYLAAIMGVPFLPSHFYLSFADAIHPDDITAYEAFGTQLIDAILERNPDLVAINHYDPLHARYLVAQRNLISLKLADLPNAYTEFIQKHVSNNALILVADCSFKWEQYEISDNHYFQVGGLGGYDDTYYREGNPEIDSWLAAQNSKHRGGWALDPGFVRSLQREAEWGLLPEFRVTVEQFANDASYGFQVINGAHPEDFSALTYTAYLYESRLHNRTPQAALIEAYNGINPTAALRSDLLPLWLPYICDDSLQFLARMMSYLPEKLPVVLSLPANLTPTPDMPGAHAWHQIASQSGAVTWVGVEPDRYPRDLIAQTGYLQQLEAWSSSHPGLPPRPKLAPRELLQMMRFLAEDGVNFFDDLLDDETARATTGARS
ncbi:MAG: hypothetical protein J5I90_13415 [Caldilineales bacterium]|nr:hypothetical protein [Caldilineales bacterium]